MAIYFSILYIRYRIGIVTEEMLELPKSGFVAIGILEALGVATGMSAGGTSLSRGMCSLCIFTRSFLLIYLQRCQLAYICFWYRWTVFSEIFMWLMEDRE